MPNSHGDGVERITRPLGAVIRDVGLAVADGQQQLDDRLLDQYREHADDGLVDLETPWYRFAEVEVDLEMHFHTVEEHETVPEHVREVAEKRGNVPDRVQQYGLVATPATPSETSVSEGERGGSSHIRFRIVPVTPPTIARGNRTDGESGENGGSGENSGNTGTDDNEDSAVR
ncbi:hypothetical protein [Salinigranum sp. GCM10025319]|uniref:hypothetical protein n=1 Tax=Salinigranum sp. GCM10025319 TaxID=3252687 RepID=UPI00360DA01C